MTAFCKHGLKDTEEGLEPRYLLLALHLVVIHMVDKSTYCYPCDTNFSFAGT